MHMTSTDHRQDLHATAIPSLHRKQQQDSYGNNGNDHMYMHEDDKDKDNLLDDDDDDEDDEDNEDDDLMLLPALDDKPSYTPTGSTEMVYVAPGELIVYKLCARNIGSFFFDGRCAHTTPTAADKLLQLPRSSSSSNATLTQQQHHHHHHHQTTTNTREVFGFYRSVVATDGFKVSSSTRKRSTRMLAARAKSFHRAVVQQQQHAQQQQQQTQRATHGSTSTATMRRAAHPHTLKAHAAGAAAAEAGATVSFDSSGNTSDLERNRSRQDQERRPLMSAAGAWRQYSSSNSSRGAALASSKVAAGSTYKSLADDIPSPGSAAADAAEHLGSQRYNTLLSHSYPYQRQSSPSLSALDATSTENRVGYRDDYEKDERSDFFGKIERRQAWGNAFKALLSLACTSYNWMCVHLFQPSYLVLTALAAAVAFLSLCTGVVVDLFWRVLMLLFAAPHMAYGHLSWATDGSGREHTAVAGPEDVAGNGRAGETSWLTVLQLYLMTTAIRLVLILLAVVITALGAHAAGSGVPELRAIISGGVYMRGYLSMKTLVVKCVALCAALGSGLPVGKEGPFIHISAIVGEQLHRLPWFFSQSRTAILVAASAAGIASCFGAPIGGILFSIEVTSSVLRVSNYWTAFYASTCGFVLTNLVFSHMWAHRTFGLFQFSVTIPSIPFEEVELLFFFALGVACGVLGAAFVRLHRCIVHWRRRHQARVCGSQPYVFALLCMFGFATITFFMGDFARLPYRLTANDLFNPIPLAHAHRNEELAASQTLALGTTGDADAAVAHRRYRFVATDWDSGLGVQWNLGLFAAVYYVFSVLSITIAVPGGVFAPMFAVGAAIGRMLGNFIAWGMFPMVSHGGDAIVVAGYAIVGAAALVSGVTRTLSVAVIVLELTGELKLLLPTLLGVTVACGVGGLFSDSIYRDLQRLKMIPSVSAEPPATLPVFDRKALLLQQERPQGRQTWSRRKNGAAVPRPVLLPSSQLFAVDIMLPLDIAEMVDMSPSVARLERLLARYRQRAAFPVVSNMRDCILIAEASRFVLREYLMKLRERLECTATNSSGACELHSGDYTLMMEPFVSQLNLSPVNMAGTTKVTKVYFSIHTSRYKAVYVTEAGRVVGRLTQRYLTSLEDRCSVCLLPDRA